MKEKFNFQKEDEKEKKVFEKRKKDKDIFVPEFGVKEKKEKEKNVYEKCLRSIFNKLSKSDLDWRLVGGIALSFSLNKFPEPRRCNGSIKDLDIVVLDNNTEATEKIEEFYKFFRKEMTKFNREHPNAPVYPEVNFSQAKSKEYLEKPTKNYFQLMSHFLREDSRFFLQFRNIVEEVAPEIFELHNLEVETKNGILSVPSFSLETIVHSYLVRVGRIKSKDIDKLKKFFKKAKDMDLLKTNDHHLYLPYHRFAKKIRKKYNITSKLWQLYTLVDYKLFNSLLSHKLIPKKIMKTIEDL